MELSDFGCCSGTYRWPEGGAAAIVFDERPKLSAISFLGFIDQAGMN